MDDLVLVDEQGNDLNLKMIQVFSYKEEQYAILINPDSMHNATGVEVYVLKMQTTAEGQTEFVLPDEEVMQEVIDEASKLLNEGGFGCDCGCGDDGCSSCSGCNH